MLDTNGNVLYDIIYRNFKNRQNEFWWYKSKQSLLVEGGNSLEGNREWDSGMMEIACVLTATSHRHTYIHQNTWNYTFNIHTSLYIKFNFNLKTCQVNLFIARQTHQLCSLKHFKNTPLILILRSWFRIKSDRILSKSNSISFCGIPIWFFQSIWYFLISVTME